MNIRQKENTMNDNDRQQVRVRTNEQQSEAVKPNVNIEEKKNLTNCPHCGAAIEEKYEICPVCGYKLVDYCTFCGSPMLSTDIDCPECGMPSDGIICPDCGTLNFRSFCRKCSKPLSRVARKSVEKAMADPKVQEAARIFAKMAELENELKNADDDDASEDNTPHEPTEAELRLRELMGKVGFKPAEKPKAQPKSSPSRSREAVMEEYQRMVEEANKVLETMVPPAGCTPQEQRNYATARKVAIMETVKTEVTLGWVCNRCHILHNDPSECGVREFGGKWTTETIVTQKKVYK